VTVKITRDSVHAPIFATEWNDNLRHSAAPWPDFETYIFLMQILTSWIKDYDNDYFKAVLEGIDNAIISVSESVYRISRVLPSFKYFFVIPNYRRLRYTPSQQS